MAKLLAYLDFNDVNRRFSLSNPCQLGICHCHSLTKENIGFGVQFTFTKSNYTAINFAYSLPQHFSRLNAGLRKKRIKILKEIYNWSSILYGFCLSINFSRSTNIYRVGRGMGTRLIRFKYEINQFNFIHDSPPQKQETCSIYFAIVIFFNFSAPFQLSVWALTNRLITYTVSF